MVVSFVGSFVESVCKPKTFWGCWGGKVAEAWLEVLVFSVQTGVPTLFCLMVADVAGFCLSLFFNWLFQKFFISLSVRPGSVVAMADHL